MAPASVVIIGSYRQHFAAIAAAADTFRQQGIDVLAPGAGRPINPGAEFVFLDTDETDDPAEVADGVLAAIAKADTVYLCDPEGYVGQSATFELGYATAIGKRCFAAEAPSDLLLRHYIRLIATPREVAALLST